MKSKGWSMVKRLNPLADRRAAPSPLQTFNWTLAEDATAGLALVAATQRLTSAGVDTPKLDSEVLLGHVLSSTRAQLYAYPERLLTADERTRFERMVVRRFHHEPVAYLVGEKAFYGLDFFVDRRVLIPRPETELLVDMVLDVALQYDPAPSNGHKQHPPRLVLADVGAGSGVVSIAALANAPGLYSYALDISPDALEVARANARRHALAERIHFLQSDLLADLPEPADIIAANLPYVALDEWDTLAPGIVNYEPEQALLGGVDGLDLIRRLLEQAPTHLRAGGVILLEVGASEGNAVAEIGRRQFPDALIEVLTDYAFRERIVRIQT